MEDEYKKALNILIANVVCSSSELTCIDDCPLYDEKKDDCKYSHEGKLNWAVKTINKYKNAEVLYVCDYKKNKECSKENCNYLNGINPCIFTTNIKYAKQKENNDG